MWSYTSYVHGVSSGFPWAYHAHIWCWWDIFGPKNCSSYLTRLMKSSFEKNWVDVWRYTSYVHGVSSGFPWAYRAHIWCWWGILGPKNCAFYRISVMKDSFSKNLHDRQNKQRTFPLNKICSHLILLMLVFFPLNNCLPRTVFSPSRNHFDMKKIKVRRRHCEPFFQNW